MTQSWSGIFIRDIKEGWKEKRGRGADCKEKNARYFRHERAHSKGSQEEKVYRYYILKSYSFQKMS